MNRTVAHFIDSDTFGGGEQVVLTLLAGLDAERWSPLLLHHDTPGTSRLVSEAKRLGIPCRPVPRLSRQSIATTFVPFTRELKALNTAILHVHLNWPLACRHAVRAAKLARVPVVATCHLYSGLVGLRSWLEQKVHAALIDRYVAVSHEVSKRLCQDLGVPSHKVRLVQNGIRVSGFDRRADPSLRALLTEGLERPIVFTPARLHPQKGHVHLLEAARLVPDALFVIAGAGPEREHLEAHAGRLGLVSRVRFLGHRQDIPELLAMCDLFVLPSLYEGLPLTVLEAMAAEKPVVATAIGGTDEAVVHGVTGLLVPPGNSKELAAAIQVLLSDKALARRFAEAGRARVVQQFSSETMVHGVAKVYEELWENRTSDTWEPGQTNGATDCRLRSTS
jgi:glycosyltransferase involved in cell wall biosynthesis